MKPYLKISIKVFKPDLNCNPSIPLSNGFNRIVKDIFEEWYKISSDCYCSFGWWYWRKINHGEVLFCTNQLSVNATEPKIDVRDKVRVFNINERRFLNKKR